MKKFMMIVITIFLIGCGAGSEDGGKSSPPKKEDDSVYFKNKLLDLKTVQDLDSILYTLFLQSPSKQKTRSLSKTRALVVDGDISGNYIKSEEYDSDSKVYRGEISYNNYKNSVEGCSSKYYEYNITMSYIRYSDATVFTIKDDGLINNATVKKGGKITITYLSSTKSKIQNDLTFKINNINYKVEDFVYTEDEKSDYVYDDYISGKIFVNTSMTNGYFYITGSEKAFKYDKCGNYLDGFLDLSGDDSFTQLEILNNTYEISTKNSQKSYFDKQWSINKNSVYHQKGLIKQDADINLQSAWEKTLGENITVAVIDSCFDSDHIDLKNNIYMTYNVNTNSKNVKGTNCHGTMVAGVIGALRNGFGITGVAPKVNLILIKIDLENSTESEFVKAFEYAKNNGANVINCSWGSNNESQIMADELRNIKNSGIITVFASGNDGDDMDDFFINDESEDPNVIGVGATEGETNDVAYYSNYGNNIDILAPGGSSEIGIEVLSENNSYTEEAGTSFASPIVTGVVALMLSQNPNLTFDDIYTKITQTADKVGIDQGANYIGGYDIYRAYGKINAQKAVQ